jgi:hypothetical protein
MSYQPLKFGYRICNEQLAHELLLDQLFQLHDDGGTA